MNLGFRTKLFAASLGVAVAALALATAIIAWDLRSDPELLRRVGSNLLIAFALAVPIATSLAWLWSVLLSRRMQAITAVARRYSAGDLTRPSRDYGSDELGCVARALDKSVQDLGTARGWIVWSTICCDSRGSTPTRTARCRPLRARADLFVSRQRPRAGRRGQAADDDEPRAGGVYDLRRPCQAARYRAESCRKRRGLTRGQTTGQTNVVPIIDLTPIC